MKKYHPVSFSVIFTFLSWIVFGTIGVCVHDIIEKYNWDFDLLKIFTIYFFLVPVIGMSSFLFMVWINKEWTLRNKKSIIILTIVGILLSIFYWSELINQLPFK